MGAFALPASKFTSPTTASKQLIACFTHNQFSIFRTTRGFRAGSKLLSTAVMLDSFVVALRLMGYIYAYHFLSSRWWLKYTQSNADWCIFYSGTLLHSLALLLYGLAVFYMEAYHDEGTFEEWAWLIMILFSLAALFGELSMERYERVFQYCIPSFCCCFQSSCWYSQASVRSTQSLKQLHSSPQSSGRSHSSHCFTSTRLFSMIEI